MNLTNASIILMILFLIPDILFGYIIVLVIKGKKRTESYLKPLIFIMFAILVFFLYRVGLKLEDYPNDYVINLVAISATLEVFVSYFSIDLVSTAAENLTYITAYYIGTISAALFVFYNIIAFVSKMFSNGIRLRRYQKSDCLYLLGNQERINIFLKSLVNLPELNPVVPQVIDLSRSKSGIYFMQITNKEINETIKIIKQ